MSKYFVIQNYDWMDLDSNSIAVVEAIDESAARERASLKIYKNDEMFLEDIKASEFWNAHETVISVFFKASDGECVYTSEGELRFSLEEVDVIIRSNIKRVFKNRGDWCDTAYNYFIAKSIGIEDLSEEFLACLYANSYFGEDFRVFKLDEITF